MLSSGVGAATASKVRASLRAGVLVLSLAAESRATEPASPPGTEPAPEKATVDTASDERNVLVLRLEGPLDPEREAALSALLGSQLSSTRTTLTVERSTLPFLAWTDKARRDPRALVLGIVDVRDPESWALYVVDAARGRAIVRRLPGAGTNAAALEEVSAILSSAVAAMREGLEVASTPVEAVVADEPPRALPPPPPPEPDPPSNEPKEPDRDERSDEPALFSAAAFVRGATLTPDPVFGVEAELGIALPLALRLSLGGAYDFPAGVTTTLGAFDLQRSLAGIRLGPVFSLGRFGVEPRLGAGAEIVHRSNAVPAPGAVAQPDQTHARFAAFLGVHAKFAVVEDLLAVALGLEGSYAPQALRFTGGENLLEFPRWSLAARAGVVFEPD